MLNMFESQSVRNCAFGKIKLLLRGTVATMVLGKVNNINWTFYSHIIRCVFSAQWFTAMLYLETCELSYCLSSLSVWASSRFITSNKPDCDASDNFLESLKTELTLESPEADILSSIEDDTADILIISISLASLPGSVY